MRSAAGRVDDRRALLRLRRLVRRGRCPGRAGVERGSPVDRLGNLRGLHQQIRVRREPSDEGQQRGAEDAGCGPFEPVAISIGERPVQSNRPCALVTPSTTRRHRSGRRSPSMTTSSKSTTSIADTTAWESPSTARRIHASKTSSASGLPFGLNVSETSNPAAVSARSRSMTNVSFVRGKLGKIDAARKVSRRIRDR